MILEVSETYRCKGSILVEITKFIFPKEQIFGHFSQDYRAGRAQSCLSSKLDQDNCLCGNTNERIFKKEKKFCDKFLDGKYGKSEVKFADNCGRKDKKIGPKLEQNFKNIIEELKKNNDKNLVRKKIDNCGKNLEKSEKKQRIFLKKVNYGR